MTKIYLFLLFLMFFMCSCTHTENKAKTYVAPSSTYRDNSNNDNQSSSKSYRANSDNGGDDQMDQPDEQTEQAQEHTSDNSCKIEDGNYSATVDYNNPKTHYSQTYTLDVEVSDCQVVQINFPKGGWLDEDHISAADIDEDGNATVDGEEGRTYDVHIDN